MQIKTTEKSIIYIRSILCKFYLFNIECFCRLTFDGYNIPLTFNDT